MARPLDLGKHPDRLQIDYALSNGASFAAIGRHFDCDERTVSLYRRRMIEADRAYFARLKLLGPSRDLPTILRDAAIHAARLRRHWRDEAERTFNSLSN